MDSYFKSYFGSAGAAPQDTVDEEARYRQRYNDRVKRALEAKRSSAQASSDKGSTPDRVEPHGDVASTPRDDYDTAPGNTTGREISVQEPWYGLLCNLDAALRHTKYSVAGRFAMSLWGCKDGPQNSLMLICPEGVREVVRAWILTASNFEDTSHHGMVKYTEQQTGREIDICIKYVHDLFFARMSTVRMRLWCRGHEDSGNSLPASVVVLTLPTLLDNCARTWSMCTDRMEKDYAEKDIHAILDRVIALDFLQKGSGPLSDGECGHVLDVDRFWLPFTTKFPCSPVLFAHGGLRIPVLADGAPPSKRAPRPVIPASLPAPLPFPPRAVEPDQGITTRARCGRRSPLMPASITTTSPSGKEREQSRRPLKLPTLFGSRESKREKERHKDQALAEEQQREARRRERDFEKKKQRGRERDREREYYTRKQAERLGVDEQRRLKEASAANDDRS